MRHKVPLEMRSNLSIRQLSLIMLAVVTLLLLAFTLLTWSVMQQSRHDLAELERLNVQQASMLNRLHVASLEGLNRMDRALERQLRPSLGDPIAALEAVEAELNEMVASHQSFVEATQGTPHLELRDTLNTHTENLLDIMRQQLAAIQAGDRSRYRQLTLAAVEQSQALTENARRFYAVADQQGTGLLEQADRQARQFGWLLIGGLLLATVVLASMAWLGQRYILQPLSQVIGHFRTMGNGDLTLPVEARGLREIQQLLSELASMQDSLVLTVRHLDDTSQHVLDSAERLTRGNQSLTAFAQRQEATFEETASYLQALTGNVAHNTESAAQANRLTDTTLDRARQSETEMQRFVDTMEEIHYRASQATEVVDLIDSIAMQTSLLALNASVEAARAGEQGRGFAVVAGEVRSLATRSAEAAQQIRELLSTSRDSTQQGHALSEQVKGSIAAIVQDIAGISELMERIDNASHDQHGGIAKLNQAMDDIMHVTRDNVRLVDLASRDTYSLHEKAQQMRHHAGRFRLDADAPTQATTEGDEPAVWTPQVLSIQQHLQGAEQAPALLK